MRFDSGARGQREPRCAFRYAGGVNLTIDLDREDDGRWIAEAIGLPGVLCYGVTRDDAIRNAERLAIDVIADRHGQSACDGDF